MRKIKPFVLLISLSIAIVPAWGLLLLNPNTSNQFTVFVAYIITFVILNYTTNRFQSPSLFLKSLILIGPLFYFVASVVIIRDTTKLLTFPIVWIFIFSILIFLLSSLKMIYKALLTIAFASLYVFAVYPQSETASYKKSINEIVSNELDVENNLSDFKFLNDKLDTVVLKNFKKPLLIETWNETCGPCIQSIRDLQDVLAKDTTFYHVYLYQYRGKHRVRIDSVFDYHEIKSPEKILIDIDSRLFNKLGMNSYPYFLIYDTTGRLRSYHSGYNSKKKSDVLQKLKGLIRSATDAL